MSDVHSQDFAELEQYLFSPRQSDRQGVRTNALLIAKNGEVLFERYHEGFNQNTPHLLWSVTKSFVNVLVGLAEQDGLLTREDVVLKNSGYEATVWQALQWSTGISWKETYEYNPLYSSVIRMLYTLGRDDMYAYVKSRDILLPPGTKHAYTSGESVLLMGYLKSRMNLQDYSSYPWKKIFDPLQMKSASFEKDRSGTFIGSSSLYLSAADLARFGEWVLQQRRGGELQAWFQESLNLNPAFDHKTAKPDELWPGAHWWVNGNSEVQAFPELPQDLFAALGHWGQSLTIVPSQNLIIVRLGDDRDGSFNYRKFLQLILSETIKSPQVVEESGE